MREAASVHSAEPWRGKRVRDWASRLDRGEMVRRAESDPSSAKFGARTCRRGGGGGLEVGVRVQGSGFGVETSVL